MKKISSFIIAIIFFFSSVSNIFASEWYIEKLLDLNYKKEQVDLDLTKLNTVYFNNQENKRTYLELLDTTNLLKKQLMKNYREWKYTTSQISWIIKSYNYFIYYTNKYFYYLKIKENTNSYAELDTAIKVNLVKMRSSYQRLKYLVSISND